MADDLYAQFGVSPKDYFIDPETNTIKRKELALPTIPELSDNRLIDDFQVSAGSKIGNKLFGTGGEERYQTWPERMIRSGSTIAGDVYSGAVPIESPTGYPGSVLPVETQMEPNIVGKTLGIGNFTVPSATSEIGRVQDMAGLAGMSSIPLAEKGALGAIGGKFYSTLENTIAGSKVQKATPEQWTSYLKNQPGVKPEELEFSLTGLGDKVLTKEELAQHVADNGIKFGEVWKGNDLVPEGQMQDPTKYHGYQLPGGENYRELLMTVPSQSKDKFIKEYQNKTGVDISKYSNEQINNLRQKTEGLISDTQYKSSHWDEPNVLAHIRMNDREVPGVGKTLHVEEIQSDWHQAGRKQGYKPTQEELDRATDHYVKAAAEMDHKSSEFLKLQQEFSKINEAAHGVPNAPFKKTWDELALKRVLSEAANKGYDAVSWTPGEAQAARYDLSKHISRLEYRPNGDSQRPGQHGYDSSPMLRAWDYSGKEVMTQKVKDASELPNYIGKEAAEKLLKTPNDFGIRHVLDGADLKVGGEGMKAFYDTMLPAKANALIKKMGGKVEYKELPKSNRDYKVEQVELPTNRIGQTRTSYDVRFTDPQGSERFNANYPTRAEAQAAVDKHNAEKGQSIPIIKITPQMRETIANKGFPLYSSGVPTFTPVDGNPHEKKYKLVPVQGNPFQ